MNYDDVEDMEPASVIILAATAAIAGIVVLGVALAWNAAAFAASAVQAVRRKFQPPGELYDL